MRRLAAVTARDRDRTLSVPPERLRAMRWVGERTYRVLGYYFGLRWNSPEIAGSVEDALGGFVVPPDRNEERSPPTPGLPRVYSLVDLGPGEQARYRLLLNGEQ